MSLVDHRRARRINRRLRRLLRRADRKLRKLGVAGGLLVCLAVAAVALTAAYYLGALLIG